VLQYIEEEKKKKKKGKLRINKNLRLPRKFQKCGVLGLGHIQCDTDVFELALKIIELLSR
jgi:hypothetical protein